MIKVNKNIIILITYNNRKNKIYDNYNKNEIFDKNNHIIIFIKLKHKLKY